MKRALIYLGSTILLALLPLLTTSCSEDASANPAQSTAVADAAAQLQRGEYLVNFGGCNHCHTPMIMGKNGPELDMTRRLSGHPKQIVMPEPPKMKEPWGWSAALTNTAFAGPWGISYAKNLTPDQVSGLGIWTEEMFLKTMRTGKHMGVSRPILPPMPWENLNHLNDQDLKAIYAYLRSLKPIRNEVPDPVIAPPPPAPAAKG